MTLNEKFKPLFNLDPSVRYAVITGGRFSSKSYTASTSVCYHVHNDNRKALYTRYTLTSAKDSIIPEFIEKIELLGLSEYYEPKLDRIIGRGNREVVFKGLKTSSGNQTAKLKSLKGFSIFVLDEAEEENDEGSFDKINLSIRESNVQNLVVLILNPTTKEHWIYRRFFEETGVQPGFNGVKDNILYIHTTYEDVIEYVPDDYLKEIRLLKKNNPDKYNHIILGGWLDRAEGVIFKNWHTGEFDDTLPFCYGQDFGSLDPDTLVKVAVDEKKKVIYLDEKMYKNNQSTDELKKRTLQITGKEALIMAESAERRLIQDIRNFGVNIKKVKKPSVVESIKQMQGYELIVTPNSSNLIKELNNYQWSDKKGEVPIDAYNHAIDATRYALTHLISTSGRYSVM